MAIIKKTTTNIIEGMEKLELLFIAAGSVKWCSLLKISMEVPQKLNIELPYDSVVLLPGIYSREMKICPHKNFYMNIYGSIIHNNQKVKTSQCLLTNEWMNKSGIAIQWSIIQP